MNLITPPGMLLTVALLAIYSAYAFLIGTIEDSWPLKAGGVASVIATYGVAMLRPWSRYLVYVLTAGFFLKLGGSIYDGVTSGYFAMEPGAAQIARSLAPAMVMAALSGLCCALVYHHFRTVPSAPRP